MFQARTPKFGASFLTARMPLGVRPQLPGSLGIVNRVLCLSCLQCGVPLSSFKIKTFGFPCIEDFNYFVSIIMSNNLVIASYQGSISLILTIVLGHKLLKGFGIGTALAIMLYPRKVADAEEGKILPPDTLKTFCVLP